MLDASRRDLMVGAGLAVAFGVSSRLVIEPAFAQKTPAPAKGFVTYKVGSAEVTAVYDGIWEKPHDPSFISNASVDDVKAAMTKAGLPADFVSIPFTVAVIKVGGQDDTVRCQYRWPGAADGRPLHGQLQGGRLRSGQGRYDSRLPLPPRSHFRLMEKETNKPIFSNSEIVISDIEYKFWTDPAVIDKLPEARKGLARRIQATFPTWKNVRQVAGEVEVAPGVRFVMAPGHTPGHRAFHLSSGSSQLMLSNRHLLPPRTGRRQSRLARCLRPGWRARRAIPPHDDGPRDRRQNQDQRLSLPVPRRGQHYQGWRRLRPDCRQRVMFGS